MRRIYIFLSLLFFLLLCSQLTKIKQLPFFNRDGKLAYIQGSDVWVKLLPNGLPHRLTTDGGNSNPEWSHSGNWLAFRRNSQLWIMQYNGEKIRMAGEVVHVNAFAWSPGDDRIAYLTKAGELWAAHADGSETTLLAKNGIPGSEVKQITEFVWSPDGNWIVYSLREWPDENSNQNPPHESFRKVSSKGGMASEVYAISFKKEDGWEPGEIILAGWVDDQILFWQTEIMSASLLSDGASLYSLPVNREKQQAHNLDICTLVWHGIIANSSDKKLFAIAEGCGRESYTGKNIAVVNPSAGKSSSVTDDSVAAIWPSWSPDGRQIAYTACPDNGTTHVDEPITSRTSQRRIWVMDSNGSNKRKLTDDENYRDERPIWLANGRRLLFVRIDQDDKPSLWLINVGGGKLESIIETLSPKNPGERWPDNYYGYIKWSDCFNYSPK